MDIVQETLGGGMSLLAPRVRGLLAGSSAYADPADTAADSDQLAEITVTARVTWKMPKRFRSPWPGSTPDAVLNAGVVRTDMLAQLVPGVQMGHEINGATTFIRGIGPNSNGTGEESSVAVYLDDIYIPTGNGSIFQLSALSGIDVLKGPQGTLFGATQPAASSRFTPRTHNSIPAPISKAGMETTPHLPAMLT